MVTLTYAHKFDSNSDYENYMNNNYEIPFVSTTYISGDTEEYPSYRTDFEPRVTDLSEVDINGKLTYTKETANCYIVHKAGWYEFPLVYGCAISAGTVHSKCYTRNGTSGSTTNFVNYKGAQVTSPYIETDTGEQVNSVEIYRMDGTGYTVEDLHIVQKDDCRYVRFNIPAMPELGGNVHICIKNASNVIMWSWHIWVYPFEIKTLKWPVTTAASETETIELMDVNLGWVRETVNGKYGTGLYYQWGRKDPMVRQAYHNTSANTLAPMPIGSYEYSGVCAKNIQTAIQHPNVFYYRSAGSGFGWLSGASSTTANQRFLNLWDADHDGHNEGHPAAKTIYDPCPPSYRVPQLYQLSGLSVNTVLKWFDSGVHFFGRYVPAASTLGSTGGPNALQNSKVWIPTCTSNTNREGAKTPTGATHWLVYVVSARTASSNFYCNYLVSYKAAAQNIVPIHVL